MGTRALALANPSLSGPAWEQCQKTLQTVWNNWKSEEEFKPIRFQLC